MTGGGFYKSIDGELLYAPTAVYGPRFTLRRAGEVADGWAWFEDEYRARAAYRPTIPSVETRDLCAAEGITDENPIAIIERITAARVSRAAVATTEEVTP